MGCQSGETEGGDGVMFSVFFFFFPNKDNFAERVALEGLSGLKWLSEHMGSEAWLKAASRETQWG